MCKHTGLGCSAFARRYWRNHFCFLFLQVLRWFTSLRCLPPAYGFSRGYLNMTRGGLPHSEIPGSKLICSSPGLIAACHVLHRLLAPRHSPYTLSSLTIRNSKLTLPDRLHTIERATVPCNTACPSACASCEASARRLNVVVGKNYRLQNIQLSKITRGAGPPEPPARSLVG